MEEAQEEVNPNIKRVLFPKLPVKKVVSYHSGTILANDDPIIEITEEKEDEVRTVFNAVQQGSSISIAKLAEAFIKLGFCSDVKLLQPIIDKKVAIMKTQHLLNESDEGLTEGQFLQLFKLIFAPAYYYGQRLRLYVGRREYDEVKELLLRQCQVNSANGEGLTPLHYACEYNRPEMIDLIFDTCKLLQQTLLVSAQDKYGWTPLHCAAHHGTITCIKKLYELFPAEAMEKCLHMKNNVGKTCLHLAAAQNRTEIVHLLVSSGADLNDPDHRGMTAVHDAAYRGRNGLFQELWHEERVDKELRDEMGRLAVDYIEEDATASP